MTFKTSGPKFSTFLEANSPEEAAKIAFSIDPNLPEVSVEYDQVGLSGRPIKMAKFFKREWL